MMYPLDGDSVVSPCNVIVLIHVCIMDLTNDRTVAVDKWSPVDEDYLMEKDKFDYKIG